MAKSWDQVAKEIADLPPEAQEQVQSDYFDQVVVPSMAVVPRDVDRAFRQFAIQNPTPYRANAQAAMARVEKGRTVGEWVGDTLTDVSTGARVIGPGVRMAYNALTGDDKGLERAQADERAIRDRADKNSSKYVRDKALKDEFLAREAAANPDWGVDPAAVALGGQVMNPSRIVAENATGGFAGVGGRVALRGAAALARTGSATKAALGTAAKAAPYVAGGALEAGGGAQSGYDNIMSMSPEKLVELFPEMATMDDAQFEQARRERAIGDARWGTAFATTAGATLPALTDTRLLRAADELTGAAPVKALTRSSLMPTPGNIARAGGDLGGDMVKEGLEEGLQQFATNIPLTDKDYLEGVGDATVLGAVGGVGQAAATGALGLTARAIAAVRPKLGGDPGAGPAGVTADELAQDAAAPVGAPAAQQAPGLGAAAERGRTMQTAAQQALAEAKAAHADLPPNDPNLPAALERVKAAQRAVAAVTKEVTAIENTRLQRELDAETAHLETPDDIAGKINELTSTTPTLAVAWKQVAVDPNGAPIPMPAEAAKLANLPVDQALPQLEQALASSTNKKAPSFEPVVAQLKQGVAKQQALLTHLGEKLKAVIPAQVAAAPAAPAAQPAPSVKPRKGKKGAAATAPAPAPAAPAAVMSFPTIEAKMAALDTLVKSGKGEGSPEFAEVFNAPVVPEEPDAAGMPARGKKAGKEAAKKDAAKPSVTPRKTRAEAAPIETKAEPAKAAPKARTKPGETKSEEPKPAEQKPSEPKPAEQKPVKRSAAEEKTQQVLTKLARSLAGDSVITKNEAGEERIDIDAIKERSKNRIKVPTAGPRKRQGGHAAMLDPEQAVDVVLAVAYYVQQGVTKVSDIVRGVRSIFRTVSTRDIETIHKALLMREAFKQRTAIAAAVRTVHPAKQFNPKPVVGRFGGAVAEQINWDGAETDIPAEYEPGTLGEVVTAFFGVKASEMRALLANFDLFPPDIGLAEAMRSTGAVIDAALANGFDVAAVRARVKEAGKPLDDALNARANAAAVRKARMHEVDRLTTEIVDANDTVSKLDAARYYTVGGVRKRRDGTEFIDGEVAKLEARVAALKKQRDAAKALVPEDVEDTLPAMQSALSEDEAFILHAIAVHNDLKSLHKFASMQYPDMFSGDLAAKYIDRVKSGGVLREHVRAIVEDPQFEANYNELVDIVMTSYAQDPAKHSVVEGGFYDVPQSVANSALQLADAVLERVTGQFVDSGLSQEDADDAADAEVMGMALASNNDYAFSREALVNLTAYMKFRLPEGTVTMSDLYKAMDEAGVAAMAQYLPALYRALSAIDLKKFADVGMNTTTAGRDKLSGAERAARFAAMDEEAAAAKAQLLVEMKSFRDGALSGLPEFTAAVDKLEATDDASRREVMAAVRALRAAAKAIDDPGMSEDVNDALDAASSVIDVSEQGSASPLRNVRIPTVMPAAFSPVDESIAELRKQGFVTPVTSREARKGLNLTQLAKLIRGTGDRSVIVDDAVEQAVDTRAARATIAAMVQSTATRDPEAIPAKLATASAQVKAIVAHKERLFSELWVATLQRQAAVLGNDARAANAFAATMDTVLAGTPVSFSQRFRRRVESGFIKPSALRVTDASGKQLTQTRGTIGSKTGYGVSRSTAMTLGMNPVRQAFSTDVLIHEPLPAEGQFELPAALARDEYKSGQAIAELDARIAKLKVQLATLQVAEDVGVAVVTAARTGLADTFARYNRFVRSESLARALEAPTRMLTARSSAAKNSVDRVDAAVERVEKERAKSVEHTRVVGQIIMQARPDVLDPEIAAIAEGEGGERVRFAGNLQPTLTQMRETLDDQIEALRLRRMEVRSDLVEDVSSVSYLPTDPEARAAAVEQMANPGRGAVVLGPEHIKVILSLKVGDSAFLRMSGDSKGVPGSPQELYTEIVRRLPDKGAMLRDLEALSKITDPMARAQFLVDKGIERGAQLGRALDPQLRLTDESDVTALGKSAADAIIMADALRTAVGGVLLKSMGMRDGSEEHTAAMETAQEFATYAKLFDGIADHYSALIVDKAPPDAREAAKTRLIEAGVYPEKAKAKIEGAGARSASVSAAIRAHAAALERSNPGRAPGIQTSVEAGARANRKKADAEFALLVRAGKVVELLTASPGVSEFGDAIARMRADISLGNMRPVTEAEADRVSPAAVDMMIREAARSITDDAEAVDETESPGRKAFWPKVVAGKKVIFAGPAYLNGWAVLENASGELVAAVVRGFTKDGKAQITEVPIDGSTDPYAAANLSGAMFKALHSAVRAAYRHIRGVSGPQAADAYARAMAVHDVKDVLRSAQGKRPPGALKSAAEARAVLVKRIGSVAVKRLEDAGRLKIVDRASDVAELTPDSFERHSSDKGLYFDDTGTAYLIAQNLTEDNVYAVMLHEVGAHYGFVEVLGDKQSELLAQLRAMPEYDSIAAQLRALDTPESQIDAEVFAHIVERQAFARDPSKLGFFQKVADAVRAFLLKWGFRGMITPQDAMILAEAAARRAQSDPVTPPDGTTGEPRRSAGERGPTTPFTPRTPSQTRAVRAEQRVEGKINATVMRGMTATAAAEYIASQAPFGPQRVLMKAVAARIAEQEAAGSPIELKVLSTRGPVKAIIAKPTDDKPARVVIRLSDHVAVDEGPAVVDETGTSTQYASREFVRAAILGALLSKRLGAIGRHGAELGNIFDFLSAHLQRRQEQARMGGAALNTVEQDIIAGTKTIDDLIANGLTDPEYAGYLRNVRYQNKGTLHQALRQALRTLLGIGQREDNLLSALMVESAAVIGVKPPATALRSAGNSPLVPEPRKNALSIAMERVDDAYSAFLSSPGRLARRAALGIAQLDQLAEIYGKEWPAIDRLWKAFSKIETEAANHLEKGGRVLHRWQSWQKTAGEQAAKDLNSLMLAATFSKTYIDREYANKAAFDLDHPWHLGDSAKWAAYQRNRAKFMSPEIGPAGRQVYADVAKYYAESNRELEAAAVQRVIETTSPGPDRDREIRGMQKLFKQSKEGPYFPLNRFGDFVVDGVMKDGTRYNAAFDTEAKAVEVQKELVAAGNTGIRWFETSKAQRSDFQLNEPVLASIYKRLQTTNEAENRALEEQLRMVQRLSAREHGVLAKTMHRDYVEGASDEMLRGFAKTLYANAHYIARTKHAVAVHDAVHDMGNTEQLARKAASAVQPGAEKARWDKLQEQRGLVHDLNEEVLRRYAMYVRAPSASEVASRLADTGNRVASVWFLTSSVSYPIVNAMQTASVAYPLLAADHGVVKAADALMRALPATFDVDVSPLLSSLREKFLPGAVARNMQEIANGEMADAIRASKKLTAGQKDMLIFGLDNGHLDISLMVDAIGAMDPRSAIGGVVEAVSSALAVLPHHSEVMNRIATALAAYNLNMDAAPAATKKLPAAQTAATEYAWETVRKSHFNYGELTRSRYMSARNYQSAAAGAAMRVFTQFQSFMLNASFRVARAHYVGYIRNTVKARKGEIPTEEAKIEAAAALKFLAMNAAVLVLVAGFAGLPFMNWLLKIINAMRDVVSDEFAMPADTKYDMTMALLSGADPGSARVDMVQALMNGAPTLADFDLRRAGFGTLLPGASDFTNGKDLNGLEKLGLDLILTPPLSGVVNNALTARDMHKKGFRPIEVAAKAAPRGVSDVLTYGVEGTKRGSTGKRPFSGEFTTRQRVVGALGFPPFEETSAAAVARRTGGVDAAQRMKRDRLSDRLQIAMDDYVWAVTQDDESATVEAEQRVTARLMDVVDYMEQNPTYAEEAEAVISGMNSLAVNNLVRMAAPQLGGANTNSTGSLMTGLEAGAALPSTVLEDED